jgi:hypothetical protein
MLAYWLLVPHIGVTRRLEMHTLTCLITGKHFCWKADQSRWRIVEATQQFNGLGRMMSCMR